MARTPITLAALATSAVSGLQVTGYRALSGDAGVEHSVILESSEGDVLVQLPTSPTAEVHHSAKILGQSALTPGVREQLPFAAPRVLGMTRCDDTRAIVSTFVSGDRFSVEDLSDDALLLTSIAETLAAIHALPRLTVTQQGLPERSSNDARLDAQAIIDRAYQSGLVPEAVRQYWNEKLADQALWDFAPVVVHGSVSDDVLIVADDHITGVLDWAELSVGDPAVDFAWLAAAEPEVLERVAGLYATHQASAWVLALVERARFWHELEIAEWLLHGLELRDQSIIDDAVELFDQLVSHIFTVPSREAPSSTLADAEAAARPESVPDHFSETASLEMLDEDRMFQVDRDFRAEELEDTANDHETNVVEREASGPSTGHDASNTDGDDEFLTVPLSFDDERSLADEDGENEKDERE